MIFTWISKHVFRMILFHPLLSGVSISDKSMKYKKEHMTKSMVILPSISTKITTGNKYFRFAAQVIEPFFESMKSNLNK